MGIKKEQERLLKSCMWLYSSSVIEQKSKWKQFFCRHAFIWFICNAPLFKKSIWQCAHCGKVKLDEVYNIKRRKLK